MRILSIFTVLSILVLTGCLSWPQNANEFMSSAGDVETSIVQKPLASVVAKNSQLFMQCFNVSYTLKPAGYALESEAKVTFLPKIFKEDGAVYFSLQKNGDSVNSGFPEDGMYMFSARVEKVSTEKTQITTNAYYMDKHLETAFHEWSAGKSEGCPALI